MKFTKVLLSAACSVLLFAGCSANNKAIITVNGEAVTKADYNEVMDVVKNNPQYKSAPEEQKKRRQPHDASCPRKNSSGFDCKKAP